MAKEIIKTDQAPAAIGPYSQAVKLGNLVFVSGQLPIDPESGNLLTGEVTPQVQVIMKNIERILQAAGSSLDRIVKTTIYISDMDHFPVINEAYQAFFPENPPARACVEVARLPKDADVEIDAIAEA